jgi:hypothetical protein
MGRVYTVTGEAITGASLVDLVSVKGSTGKTVKIKRIRFGATDTTLPTAQMIEWVLKYLPATVTAGSGGSAATPGPVDPGDAAASFTARVGDTTGATSNGTTVKVIDGGDHIYQGVDVPVPDCPVCGLNEQLTLTILSTLSGTAHLSVTVWVEETGA